MGSKKIQVWLPILFAIVMIAGMLIGYQLKEKTGGSRFFSVSRQSSIQELIELVKGKYVDKVSADSINAAIDSTYISFAGTSDYNASTQTGSRGLYRALLGDSFSFIPSAGSVSQSQSVSRSSSTPLLAPSSSVPAGS